VKKVEKSPPSSVRRDRPRVFSSAALANCTAPSARSTATSVDIRSSEWKRSVPDGEVLSGGVLTRGVGSEGVNESGVSEQNATTRAV